MSKSKCPLIIVSIDQDVPVLDQNHCIVVHSDLVHPSLVNKTNFFLSYTSKENLSIEDNDYEYLKKHTGPVSFYCEVIALENRRFEEEELTEIIFKPIFYASIKQTFTEDKFTFASAKKLILDKFAISLQEEVELTSFICFLLTKIKDLKSEEILEEAKSFQTSTLLSDYLIFNYVYDPYIKYIYTQILSERERVEFLVTILVEDAEIEEDNILIQKFKERIALKKSGNITKAKPEKKIYPLEVQKLIDAEIKKLSRIPSTSSEAQSVQSYIETLQKIPWDSYADSNVTLDALVKAMTTTHYGLENVKEHVLQHLVLENHIQGPIGSVMCFIGPPGTGKTSIAKAIGKATNREVIRIALGGVTDESEIRGHRRTYVASKQGRLIDGLIKAKQMNPVIILDEVDKLSSDPHKGDPTSALLELLDPEQNEEFVDRYIEIGVDFSKAFFICTANDKERIPSALLDRLEFIEFEPYTYDQRKKITEDYIYPSILKKYKMDQFSITLDPTFFESIGKIESLRKIEKTVSKVLKETLVKLLVQKEESAILDSQSIKKPIITTRKIGF